MGNLQERLTRLWRGQSGVQTVEFAFLLPLVLLIIIGMIDLGRGYFSWLIITNGAREGARAAVVGKPLSTVGARVQDGVSGLYLTGVDVGSCPSSAAGRLCITVDNLGGNPGASATVHVRYNFSYIVLPSIMQWVGVATFPNGVLQLHAQSSMRLE
ncbi:MAG: pilus assembly protein [Chloroflexi bacterium]|nr:pilus assembly protein [Chloroflexota bacterium]